MTETVLVAGTASHVGKSTIVAGLCRLLAKRGHAVAPFKAQNMSNNARVAMTPDGEWGEIGVSQFVQARAAGIVPMTDHNPVLLKPRGSAESQLVIDGEAVGNYSAGQYYDESWERAREAAAAAHRRLAAEYDVIVAEGAGSIAEINLSDRDLANLETARFADAKILLVVDIERGGAFASLYGTLELLPDDIRNQVAGAVINKFRGDPSLLDPGIAEIEARTGIPVLGVVPHDDPGLPAEDSLSLPDDGEEHVGGDDDIPKDSSVTVGVPRLPRISNFTDLAPLRQEPGVRLAYLDPSATLDAVDAVVLPGSKNTVDDLLALREAGFGEKLREFEGPIVGLCGGYQLLGERLVNAGIESTQVSGTVDGLGLLPVETRFREQKAVERVHREIDGIGPLSGATGSVTGYEIHMGRTDVPPSLDSPLGPESAATDRILGTYLHGLFENTNARRAFIENVFESAGLTPPPVDGERRTPADCAASLVEEHVDLEGLGVD